MATKTLGLTGRNYSTLAAYSSYANSLALTAPEILEVYNDGGAVLDTTAVVLNGWTGGSATNTLTIRAAAGQGWNANANVQTNAFRFNAANGAALSNNVLSATGYTFGGNVILQGMQVRLAANTPANTSIAMQVGASFALKQCIVDCTGTGVLTTNGTGIVLENSLLHMRGAGYAISNSQDALTLTSLTMASNGGGSYGVKIPYANTVQAIAKNVIAFGFATDYQQSVQSSSTNNATDKSTFGGTNWGANGQVSLTAADFVSVTVGSEDWKPSATSKLINAGATAGPTVDAAGTARPQGALYDIGAWEYVIAAGATVTLAGANSTSNATCVKGAITVTPPAAGTVNLVGSNASSTATSIAGAITVTATVGTITSDVFRAFGSPAPLASMTIPHVTVVRMSDRVQVLNLPNLATNGSGVLALASAAIVTGTWYMLGTWNADGSARGFKAYLAT